MSNAQELLAPQPSNDTITVAWNKPVSPDFKLASIDDWKIATQESRFFTAPGDRIHDVAAIEATEEEIVSGALIEVHRDLMRAAKVGNDGRGRLVGVAANQVWQKGGAYTKLQNPEIPRRVIAVMLDFDKGSSELTTLINPEFIPDESKGKYYGVEGCFACLGLAGDVCCWCAGTFIARGLDGKVIERELIDDPRERTKGIARFVQHEERHLNKKRFPDMIVEDMKEGRLSAGHLWWLNKEDSSVYFPFIEERRAAGGPEGTAAPWPNPVDPEQWAQIKSGELFLPKTPFSNGQKYLAA